MTTARESTSRGATTCATTSHTVTACEHLLRGHDRRKDLTHGHGAYNNLTHGHDAHSHIPRDYGRREDTVVPVVAIGDNHGRCGGCRTHSFIARRFRGEAVSDVRHPSTLLRVDERRCNRPDLLKEPAVLT